MTVITRKRYDNFSIIPNAVANDTTISFEARGLLIYLLSKPNDWQVNVKNLRKAGGGIGQDKVYRILSELSAVGYIYRQSNRDQSGQFVGSEYMVYDQPIEPRGENPDAVFPDTADPEPAHPDTTKPAPNKVPEAYLKPIRTKDALIRELLVVLDLVHANALVDHREALQKALTVKGAQALVRELLLCDDPNAAVDYMIQKGWACIKNEWIEKSQRQKHRKSEQLKDPVVEAAEELHRWENANAS